LPWLKFAFVVADLEMFDFPQLASATAQVKTMAAIAALTHFTNVFISILLRAARAHDAANERARSIPLALAVLSNLSFRNSPEISNLDFH
jgi:hypothetical protein